MCLPPTPKRDPRQRRVVVSADERDLALRVPLDDLQHIVRVDAAVGARRLPGVAGVVVVLVLLHPDARFREEVDSAGVIPVHVRQQQVGDVLGLDAERRDRLGRLDVILHRELREVAVAVEAGVDDRDPAVDPFQHPDHHRDVHAPRSVGAGDEARNGEVGKRREADGVDLVAVHVRANMRSQHRSATSAWRARHSRGGPKAPRPTRSRPSCPSCPSPSTRPLARLAGAPCRPWSSAGRHETQRAPAPCRARATGGRTRAGRPRRRSVPDAARPRP